MLAEPLAVSYFWYDITLLLLFRLGDGAQFCNLIKFMQRIKRREIFEIVQWNCVCVCVSDCSHTHTHQYTKTCSCSCWYVSATCSSWRFALLISVKFQFRFCFSGTCPTAPSYMHTQIHRYTYKYAQIWLL